MIKAIRDIAIVLAAVALVTLIAVLAFPARAEETVLPISVRVAQCGDTSQPQGVARVRKGCEDGIKVCCEMLQSLAGT